MDKQKQIKEMEKDIDIRMEMAKAFIGSMNNGVEGWLAEYLVKKGWIKPAEGAVVLTKEEHIQMLKDLANSNEIAYLSGYGKGSTETAEKFAERLKAEYEAIGKELQQSYDDVFGSDLPEWSVPDVVYSYGYIDKIDEICKEITEGKDDATSRSI